MKNCPLLQRAHGWDCITENSVIIRGIHRFHPERPTIHFLPGTGFCGLMYWPYLRHFTSRYGIFTQDYQGHGDSDNGEEFAGWDGNLRRCKEVIEKQLANENHLPLIGMGHSYGGVMTALLAADHPEWFSALVLLDPILLPEEWIKGNDGSPSPMTLSTLRRRTQWASKTEAEAYFSSKPTFKNWHPDALCSLVDHLLEAHPDGRRTLKCPPEMEAPIYSDPLTTLWDALRRLRVPTVIVYGDRTIPTIPPGAQKAAAENPMIQCARIRGSHNFMQEEPEMTYELVQSLINSVLVDAHAAGLTA
ncbi:MAG: alpha/beta hydrolase [Pseudomonadota bacterium]|nr:alpha/beta hydrolase [Pseudomonadota bacterium]